MARWQAKLAMLEAMWMRSQRTAYCILNAVHTFTVG